MNKLKYNLKQLLKEFDIPMAQLARETQIPPQTLNNWASGAEPKNISQVKRVADYFNISVDELCFGISKNKNMLKQYDDEINAGIFEVVLRKIKKDKNE